MNGHGLAFNPGETLEAYSNFLWIIICAALFKFGLTLTSITPYVGILLAMGGLVFLWLISRRRASHPAQLFLPLLVYATAGPFVLYVVSGMESALFGLLLLALVYFADRIYEFGRLGAWIGLTVVGLLIALTRPDGIIILPVSVAYMVFDLRRTSAANSKISFPILSIVTFALFYGVYTVWRVGYFGEWLPTSFMSKGHDAFPILTALKQNFDAYFISGGLFETPVGYLYIALALAGTAGLVSSHDRDAAYRGDRLALVLAALMFAVYTNFVDWMPTMRYQAPLVGLLCIPLVGAQRVIVGTPWVKGLSNAGLRMAILLVILMGVFGLHRIKIVTRVISQSQAECILPMATWFKDVLPAYSLIAISDIGAVSYYSGLRILDIHTESLTDAHIVRGGFTAAYALSRQPHLVAFPVRGLRRPKMAPQHYKLFSHDEFIQKYRFFGTIRHRWPRERSYWVFIHKDVRLRADVIARFPTGMGTITASDSTSTNWSRANERAVPRVQNSRGAVHFSCIGPMGWLRPNSGCVRVLRLLASCRCGRGIRIQ